MNGRRDFLIGSACMAAAAAAVALVPRRHAPLLAPGAKLADVVPRAFQGWSSRDVSDLVAPKEEDSLAARLYGETVGRIYSNPGSPGEIMMLLAYGDTQSDDLQLHRPEICYPAFGFAISQSASMAMGLTPEVSLPSRHLVAEAADRRETILYWSRLGQYLPLDRKQQQLDRLFTAMKGEIADGVLARFSVAGREPDQALSIMKAFVPGLVRAVSARSRDVLIGTERAAALRAAGV